MHFSAPEKGKLLHLVQKAFPDSSTNSIKQWINIGRIQVNGQIITAPHTEVKIGDDIELLQRKSAPSAPFPILYEDGYMVIVNKPSGLLSVSLDSGKEENLHAMLKALHPKKKVWVIHRLDRETSGAIAFAFDEKAYTSLKEQLQKRTMKRRYLVLVEGIVQGKGIWDSFLKEDASLVMHASQEATPGSERAITHWKTLDHDGKNTLLECHLVTGKKNQIRVQAAAFSHPVVGDVKYGSHSSHTKLMLHAAELECHHPITGRMVCVYAEPPVQFMKGLSKKLQQSLHQHLSTMDSRQAKS